MAGGGLYFMDSYPPDETALEALKGNANYQVNITDDYVSFIPQGLALNEKEGLLFYQGAKVEAEAYAVLGKQLAEKGIPVVIAKMPVRFAIFDAQKGLELYEQLGLKGKWAIGGHSLGGAMAAKIVYEYPEAFDKLILLAAYPSGKSNDLSNRQVKVLSIWGTKDGLVTAAKIEAHRAFLPAETMYYKIKGANHAQFGNYGPQKNDLEAEIDAKTQMDLVAEKIGMFFLSKED